MIPVAPQQWQTFYGSHLEGFRKVNDKQAQARCPFHEDKDPSMSIDIQEGLWNCKGCGEKGNSITFADKKRISRDTIPGWEVKHEFDPVVARYVYQNANGDPSYRINRKKSKQFPVDHFTPDKQWVKGLNGTPKVLYHLPDILVERVKDPLGVVAEGEKDVDTLRTNGFAATCNPFGATGPKNWLPEFSECLRGFPEVVIIADKDDTGRKHAQRVAVSVSKVIERVKVLELPGEGVKDATDYFDAGGTPKAFMDLVQAAPVWAQSITNADQSTLGQILLRDKVKSAADLLAESLPPLEMFIEDVWVEGGRGFIAGNPNVGKTWLAIAMTMAAATGGRFLGRYAVKRPGPCLIVEEEADQRSLQRRIHQLAKGLNLNPEDLRGLHYLTRSYAKIPRDTAELIHIIKDKGCRAVVFDSFRRLHDGKESSSDEMQPVLEAFARINDETKANLIIIHHLAKSGPDANKSIFERMRGSSDFWAWRDCILGLEGREDDTTSTCHFEFRDAERTAPLTILRKYDAATEAITLEGMLQEEGDEFKEKAEEVRLCLKGHMGAMSSNQIFKIVRGGRGFTLRVLKWMQQNRQIAKDGTGWLVCQ